MCARLPGIQWMWKDRAHAKRSQCPAPTWSRYAFGTGIACCRRQRTRKRGLGRLFANRSLHLGDLRSG